MDSKNGRNRSTIIAAVIGAIAAIAAAIIGEKYGKGVGVAIEQKNVQKQIDEVRENKVNVSGDNNEVTINDVEDLVREYLELKDKYESKSKNL